MKSKFLFIAMCSLLVYVIYSTKFQRKSINITDKDYIVDSILAKPPVGNTMYEFKCETPLCSMSSAEIGIHYREIQDRIDEEMWTVLKLLKYKTGGFFVDCGANNGEWFSNTLSLEIKYDWTGLLIESDPILLSDLKSVGRKAWIASACLSPQTSPKNVTMQRFIGSYVNSGIADLANWSEVNGGQYEAQCYPLHMLLNAINIWEIDFLSLDVEGAELEILKTIPFDKISIKIIAAEVHRNTKEITEYLQLNGYKFVKNIKAGDVLNDNIYVHISIL